MPENTNLKITECPRDAMQGIEKVIPTQDKIDYLNRLLKVGFDVIDVGSFVSPKIIPQMSDTQEVLDKIDTKDSKSKLSVIIANKSGAKKALEHEKVAILGFPFSISEKFQNYNTNKSREEAFEMIKEIQEDCQTNDKELLIYLSMAFGNPYGENWDEEMVEEWTARFHGIGIKTINLSDTVGVAQIKVIENLFGSLIKTYPEIEFGAHFHTAYDKWFEKIEAAYQKGCRKFDAAIKGYGGCPMSKSDLVGNMPTEKLINFAEMKKLKHGLNIYEFESAYNSAIKLFSS